MGYFVEISGDAPRPPAPVNAPPVITSNGGGASAVVSVAENTLAVTTVAASDPEGDAPTFAIAGGADAALFSVDAAGGALAFRTAPDFEAPVGADNVYDVVVRVSAAGGEDTRPSRSRSRTRARTRPATGPPGFTAFNGHYYKYVRGDFTHSQASAQARAEGGHLATIASARVPFFDSCFRVYRIERADARRSAPSIRDWLRLGRAARPDVILLSIPDSVRLPGASPNSLSRRRTRSYVPNRL